MSPAVEHLPNANHTDDPAAARQGKPGGALVMGGDYRALALVRSLGRKGVNVWVIHQSDHKLAGSSRYAQKTLFFPSWNDASALNFLIEAADKYSLQGWLLLPTSDESVRLVASHHSQLSQQFDLTVPPWDMLQHAVDKRLMNQMAESLGVDHARTIYPWALWELAAAQDLEYPVIVKPATRDQPNRLTFAKAWRADDRESLLARYKEACQLFPPDNLMIQELIPGGGENQVSFAALCEEGRVVASFVAQRTRQYPMDFGRASTYVETIEDPGVVDPATRFLAAMGYSGLVEVEFKRDPRSGQYKLLDVNPRVWGWFSLCESAGVDLGFMLWQLHQGRPVAKVQARTGVRWVRLASDIVTSIREIRAGKLPVGKYLRSLRGPLAGAIFSADDVRPGLLDFPLLCMLACKRILNGTGD